MTRPLFGENDKANHQVTISNANATAAIAWSCLYIDGSVASSSQLPIDEDIALLGAYAISTSCVLAVSLLMITVGWLLLYWPGIPGRLARYLKALILLGLKGILWTVIAPAVSGAGLRLALSKSQEQLQVEVRYGTCFTMALMLLCLHVPLPMADLVRRARKLGERVAFVSVFWLKTQVEFKNVLLKVLREQNTPV